jgi:hypothetical protein
MKKLFIFVGLVFLIITIGLFVFILTFDPNSYKPLLTEKIEEAIQKDVRIGNISLDILPGLKFRIDGLSIKDIDGTWQDPLLKVALIEVSAKPLPLIKKDIQIQKLDIKGLNITIEKDTFLKGVPIEAGPDSSYKDMGIGPLALGALKFLARSISITDSNITYDDYRIGIIEARLRDISLYGPLHIDARLSVFGRGTENVSLRAVLYPELQSRRPYIENLALKIDLARFSLIDALYALGKPDIAKEILGEEITGDLAINSERIYLDPKGLYSSDMYIILSNGATDILPVKDGIRDIELKAKINKGDILIQRLTGVFAGGSFSAKGLMRDVSLRQDSDLDIILQDIDVGRLLPEAGPGRPHFEALLNMDMGLGASGLTKEKILNTLTAKGRVKLDRAILKNMNILTAALERIDMLPGLVRKLKSRLPERYKELLRQDYTSFRPLETGFNITKKKLLFQDVIIESDAFYLKGGGYLDSNRYLSISSDLFIPEDLSEAFAGAAREFSYLQNSRGVITMPIAIYGRFPEVVIKPNLDYVIERLAVSKGQELLESIFKKDDPGAGHEEETKDEEEKEELKPAEAIIRSIFDIITAPQKTRED